MVLLRELLAGSTRFNDLRRGVPKMSPTLLAQRLRDLEQAGIVERHPIKAEKSVFEYRLTVAGEELRPIIIAMGTWGQRWVESQMTAIWMGLKTVRESSKSINFDGSRKLQRSMQTWLGLSPFATEKNQLS